MLYLYICQSPAVTEAVEVIHAERKTMINRKTKVSFQGTKEQEAELRAAIGKLRGEKGALITILQKAQEVYGYLPIEVQKLISDETDIPLEEIYGVVTFYAQFSLNPMGQYKISCCLGTACYVKGAGDFYKKVSDELGIKNGECTPDGKFSLEACRCIGACGLAPVLTVNDDVYGRLTEEEVDKILAKY
jgi:NADP-reducing hydrogenase subunit HndA